MFWFENFLKPTRLLQVDKMRSYAWDRLAVQSWQLCNTILRQTSCAYCIETNFFGRDFAIVTQLWTYMYIHININTISCLFCFFCHVASTNRKSSPNACGTTTKNTRNPWKQKPSAEQGRQKPNAFDNTLSNQIKRSHKQQNATVAAKRGWTNPRGHLKRKYQADAVDKKPQQIEKTRLIQKGPDKNPQQIEKRDWFRKGLNETKKPFETLCLGLPTFIPKKQMTRKR